MLGCASRLCLSGVLILAGCSSNGSTTNTFTPAPPASFPGPPPGPDAVLTMADVQNIVTAAAQSVNDNTMIIAVVDRQGDVLAVFRKPGAPATVTGDFGLTVSANDEAVGVAHTAGLFSTDQSPLSSRAVRFLGGIHYPPGVANVGAGDLYSIENTNRGCPLVPNYLPGQALPPSTALSPPAPPNTPGLGIVTGKADLADSDPTAVNPGGVPIFKANAAGGTFMVGSVGVVASTFDIAEFAAFSGAFSPGFGINVPPPGEVVIGGVAVPFVANTTIPAGSSPGTATGAYLVGPLASPGPVPVGDLIAAAPGPLGGLTAAQVTEIFNAGEATAAQTRAAIRLPLESRARMTYAIADLDGTIIGLRHTRDATVESIDVSVSLARNMVYFNGPNVVPGDIFGLPAGVSLTNSALNFTGTPLFPQGVNGTPPGPLFNLFKTNTLNSCSQGSQPPGPNQSGTVFLAAGGLGLYDSTGKLIGGLGVRGDGADRDDFVANGAASGGINFVPTCSGTNCFLPAPSVRVDQICIDITGTVVSCSVGVRLPFSKFPRNPTE